MSSNQIEIDETETAAGYSYLFGRFHLQVAEDSRMTLFSDGHAIALSVVESTILRELLEKRGQFVKTEDLLRCVSPSSTASENIVHGAVRGLRRTLNDAELIKTERSKGYCFTGAVQRRSDNGSDEVLSEPIEPPVSEDIDRGLSVAPAAPAVTLNAARNPFVVVALLVSAPVVLLPFGLVFFGGTWESLPKQLGFIQALMILVAIGYDFYFSDARESGDADTETRRARFAVQQLRRSWRLLLASWCALYITLPFSEWFAPASGQAPSWQWQALQVIATVLNNCSALMLVLCYLVLNRPTINRVADRDVEDVPLTSGLLLVGGIGLLEAALVALSGRFGFPDYARDVLFGADLLSGVVGGIAMALCISRLDSRLLGTSGLLPVVPIVLYLYVVIQPFYPLINRTFPNSQALPQHFDIWIMQLAFMLKSIMYIYVTELFTSERLLFYMIYARRVYESVETEWSAFKSAG
ncbi:MAG TPA: winged helix-turn-helix domain-containing protein [Pyrinomonadaceae bacterium]|nr:winged helix-turn-helix domain-containing protein [Pyrinomonadaceae bacterium]